MKKLLFILTLMISFSTVAQDDSIKRFRFKANASSTNLDRNHLFSEDLVHCNGNVLDATNIDTFTYNPTTRQLSFNGAAQGDPVSNLRGRGLANLFNLSYNTVNVTSRFGTVTRALVYNEATNSWD